MLNTGGHSGWGDERARLLERLPNGKRWEREPLAEVRDKAKYRKAICKCVF